MDNVRWRVEPTLIILRGVWILEYLCEDNFVNERFLPNIFAVIEYYSFSGLSIFACPFDIHYLCNCYQNLQKRGTLQTRCQCIGDVMVSVLASSVVDRGFEPRSGQTKDYTIGICCFSAKHAALRRKSKDWLARNRIMCPSRATCLPTDCCFSELAL